jgi:hypothetical protein
MAQKNSQTHKFDIKNFKEIYDYCYLNEIIDINSFIEKCLKQGFDIEKYGLIGEYSEKTDEIGEKQTEIEVIREIRVEVPVEVTKEVVKYVEVPVEIIKEVKAIQYVEKEVIKEVPVEKIVYIYDKKEENSVPNIDKIGDKPEPIIIEKIVEVIKEVDVSGSKVLMLQETLNKLRKELTDKNTRITELEGTIKKLEQTNINQGAVFMKGSNLTQNL